MGIVAVVVVAGVALMASRQVAKFSDPSSGAARLARGQRTLQDADMMHDAIRADVLASALASLKSQDAQWAQAATDVREHARRMLIDLQDTAIVGLPADIVAQLEDAQAKGLAYDALAMRVVDAAGSGVATAADYDAFDQAFLDMEIRLGRVTSATDAARESADARIAQQTRSNRRLIVGLSIAALLAIGGAMLYLSLWLLGQIRRLSSLAERLASGELTARAEVRGHDELAGLGRSFNTMAEHLNGTVRTLQAEADREVMRSQLDQMLDLAEVEEDVCSSMSRALGILLPNRPAELLLADSSRAHLRHVSANPAAGSPGCGVGSPWACPAVRHGQPQTYPSSDALNACPRLTERAGDEIGAVCVPVTFMGRAIGVLHSTGPAGSPAAEVVERLTTLATAVGSRIGTVRAFDRAQLQASTDGLTGLLNRRAFEDAVTEQLAAGTAMAIALADLDHFKLLNDTYGHDTGDRALRLFASLAKAGLRGSDLVARYGGEEFVFALSANSADEAAAALERLVVELGYECSSGAVPAFTASFGICHSTDATDLSGMVRIADAALYRAKGSGRNRTVLADAEDIRRGRATHPDRRDVTPAVGGVLVGSDATAE